MLLLDLDPQYSATTWYAVPNPGRGIFDLFSDPAHVHLVDLARSNTLEQKVLAEERVASLDKEHAKHKDETAKLHRALRDLEHKIRQARHRRSLLAARMVRADSARTVNSVLKRTDTTSALATFQRLEQRVERAEAMEQAFDRLDDRAPEAQDLQRQFEERDRQEQLQKEFDELKRRLGD